MRIRNVDQVTVLPVGQEADPMGRIFRDNPAISRHLTVQLVGERSLPEINANRWHKSYDKSQGPRFLLINSGQFRITIGATLLITVPGSLVIRLPDVPFTLAATGETASNGAWIEGISPLLDAPQQTQAFGYPGSLEQVLSSNQLVDLNSYLGLKPQVPLQFGLLPAELGFFELGADEICAFACLGTGTGSIHAVDEDSVEVGPGMVGVLPAGCMGSLSGSLCFFFVTMPAE